MADPADLTTVDSVKAALKLPANDTELDDLIPEFITDASYLIMDHCKREFAPIVVETRRFKVESYRVDFAPWDLQVSTTYGGTGEPIVVELHPETDEPLLLTDGQTAGSNQQYMLKPVNPQRGVYQSIQFSGFLIIVSQTLMQFGYALMDVTGTWGFPSVPPNVSRACDLTVASWLTRTSPGSSGQYGIPHGAAQGAIMHTADWDLPWAAKKMLGRFMRGNAKWAGN